MDEHNTEDEYMPKIVAHTTYNSDMLRYSEIAQSVRFERNSYYGLAKPFRAEISPILATVSKLKLKEQMENGYLP